MACIEQPLSGGNTNSGVVRIGATVRRGQTAASPAVHQLLRHLEAKGFDGSPRFLGIDAEGREILSFIAGTTGIRPPSGIPMRPCWRRRACCAGTTMRRWTS